MSTQVSSPSQRGRRETSFIETSGGIMTEQLLYKLRDEACSESAVQPETFAFLSTETPQSSAQLEERVSESWEDLVERWDEISRENEVFEMDVSTAGAKWMLKLFERIGFNSEHENGKLSTSGIEFKPSNKTTII